MFKKIRKVITTISHFEHVIKCYGYFPLKTMCFISTSSYMLILGSDTNPYTLMIYILQSHLFYTIFLVLILYSHKPVSFLPKYFLGSSFQLFSRLSPQKTIKGEDKMSFLTYTTAFDVKEQMKVLVLVTGPKPIRVQKLRFLLYSMNGSIKSLYTNNTCLKVLVSFHLVSYRNSYFLHVLDHLKYQNLSVSHYNR